MALVVVERLVHCKSDPQSLWPFLSDTERMNRVIGLAAVTYSPLSDSTAARYLAKTKLGGFVVEYEERPYEWAYLERFGVERRMRSGPAKCLKSLTTLTARPDGGTDVALRVEVDLHFGILVPVAQFQTRRSLNNTVAEIERIDRGLVSHSIAVAEIPCTQVNEEKLQRLASKLSEVAPAESVARLRTYLTTANDVEVMRLRPHVLADGWGLDRRVVLETLLQAVHLGLLELRWELVCPSCQAPADNVSALAALKDHGVCQFCELEFELDLDAAVEATFAPPRTLRPIDHQPYCIGGPGRTPNVFAQAILPARGSVTIQAPPRVGRYRLFIRGGQSVSLLVAPDGKAEAEVDAQGSRGPATSLELRMAPRGQVKVTNRADSERHLKVESIEWTSQAATAFELSTLPVFRKLFSTDLLRLGAALKIAQVSIFFSDLTDSTQLYASVGDGEAFNLVQKHFEVVIRLIEKHRGALVKTIGDAVMAVFVDELDALAASRAILQAFEEFRASERHGAQTRIKLGVYSGPCFAMTANGVLDYFGQTVNLAARLQAQASGGELAISAAAAERALQHGTVAAAEIRSRSWVNLKGVSQPIEVVKISTGSQPALQSIPAGNKTGT